MSFNPPPDPTPGLTFQYGNIIWKYDAVSGVWNIQDGNLVGAVGPKGDQGDPGPTGPRGATGDPSAGDGSSIIVSDGVVTARLGDFGITGVMGVTGRFGVSNGIISLLPASAGASGIASFESGQFNVSGTGHVSLASTVTGDTVQGGIAIRTVKGAGNVVTINNVGVTSFNGLTGAVLGVSSINNVTPFFNGSINLNTEVGGALFSYTPSVVLENTVSLGIGARLATASLTGVARFPATHFAVSNGSVSLSGPFGIIGVTGIAVGDNDVGLTGRVQITAGDNVTVTRSGNTITIASSGGGGAAAGITASPQQVLFSSGNGGTGSDNFVFNGLAATFGGANTQFTITGPTFTIGNNTVVRGGVFYDAAESAPYSDFANSAVNLKGASGSVQRIRINPANTYTISMDTNGWTDVPGVAESVVVIMQCANGKTGQFNSDILTQDPRPILGGVTGGVDVFTLMRIPTNAAEPVRMAFPIARGMTAPNFSIGTQ